MDKPKLMESLVRETTLAVWAVTLPVMTTLWHTSPGIVMAGMAAVALSSSTAALHRKYI